MDIKILLVEDDENICNTVKTFLVEAGFFVDACFDGDEAHEKIYSNTYQLAILDIMLPSMNGHDGHSNIKTPKNAVGIGFSGVFVIRK